MTACSPLSQLERASQTDRGDFHSNLAQEYLAFAQSEAELERADTSDYFAKKGLKAARMQHVPPEKLSDWELEEDIATQLKNSRDRLLGVRTDFLERVVSQHVARAQLFFDCWVMQASEKTTRDLTLPCRQEFVDAMQIIEEVVDALGPAPDITLPAHYTILFPFGSAEITSDGEYAVRQVVATTTVFPEHRLEVIGFADRAGSADYNQALSLQRAEAVADALAEAGLSRDMIEVSALGETEPEIPTLDGITRSRNRRVEVWIFPPEPETTPTEAEASSTEPVDE